MLISEVGRRSGVPPKTLRYYEDIGLIDAPDRSASGYRNFDEAILDRLAFIRSAQALGLTLGEIRSIVSLRDQGEVPCGHVLDLLRDRTAKINQKIRELRGLRAELGRLVARAANLDPADCDPSRVCHLISPTSIGELGA